MQTSSVLTILDGYRNGKGDWRLTSWLPHRYTITQCDVRDGNLVVLDLPINLDNISIVIFNFNEDLYTYNFRRWNKNLTKEFKTVDDMIQRFKKISRFIKEKYPSITIYQDPEKCFDLGDKAKCYDKIKGIKNNIFRIPKYKCLEAFPEDINEIDFYPVIIKSAVPLIETYGFEVICNNKEELLEAYKNFEGKGQAHRPFCVEFIDSYVQEIECNHSLRFMVTNDNLIDHYFRPSAKWNIHNGDQDLTKALKADSFFKEFYIDHKKDIDQYFLSIANLFGNAFYSYDAILKDKKIYICEIGLKTFDEAAARVPRVKGLNKDSYSIRFMENHYKKLLINLQNFSS